MDRLWQPGRTAVVLMSRNPRQQRVVRSDRQTDEVTVPPGAPSWVTPELIAHTLRVWQPYYREQLIPEDALDMILSVGRIVEVVQRGGGHETVCCPGPGQQP